MNAGAQGSLQTGDMAPEFANIELPNSQARPRQLRIARLQLFSTVAIVVAGALLPILARAVSALFGQRFAESGIHEKIMVLHAAVMIYLGLIPGMLLAYAYLFVPELIENGKRRGMGLNWASLSLYWLGAALVVGSILLGRIQKGFVFIAAYKAVGSGPVIAFAFGVLSVGLACAVTGFRVLAALRPRHVHESRFDSAACASKLFCITGITHALVIPVQLLTVILMLLERLGLTRSFDPAHGGNPVLLQHLFWYGVQPILLASVLPAMGVLSQIVLSKVSASQVANSGIVNSALALTIMGFLTWGGHLVNGYESPFMAVMFSCANLLLLIPALLPVPIWLAGLRRIEIRANAPSLFAMCAIMLLGLVLVTAIPLGMLGTNVYLHGTYYEVGFLHYFGLAVCGMSMLAGMHYASPTLATGRTSSRLGYASCVCLLLGSLVTFADQLRLGIQGVVPSDSHYLAHFGRGLHVNDFGLLAFMTGIILALLHFRHGVLVE